MPEPPDLHGALAIEAVDWAPGGEEKLTISVRGRWRRRRPMLSGQPVLVVEAEGQRHRFPATPEPPSVGGAPPGGWQMTFSVPAWLAPHLGGRAWLQLGVAVVPLPRALGPGQRSADEDTLVERRARTAELAEQRARTRVSEAEAVVAELTIRIEQLEGLLEQARDEPRRLRETIAERDQQRRAAEQRAHAEHATRLELEEALEAADHGDDEQLRLAAGELAAAEDRVRQLELELEVASRRADEAERLAVAARSAPVVAEPVAEPLASPDAAGAPDAATAAFDLGRELAVAARPSAAPLAVPEIGRGAAGAAELRALREERDMVAGRAAAVAALAAGAGEAGGEALVRLDETVVALRRELGAQAAANARVTNRLAQAERQARSETADTGADGLADILAELRAELGRLAEIADREADARLLGEQRVAELEQRLGELEGRLRDRDERAQRAFETIGELRALLASVAGAELEAGVAAPPGGPDAGAEPDVGGEAETEPEPESGGDVELERFDAALARLRAAAGEPSAGEDETDFGESERPDRADSPIPAAGATRPWLRQAFSELAGRDPQTAGELFLGLLPAQGAAWSEPVAYDLVLAPEDVVRLSSAGGGARPAIERAGAPRELGEVAFRATGGPAELARLLAAGRLRRLIRRRRLARVQGDRRALAVPAAILDSRLHLGRLHGAGVRLTAPLLLELVASMVSASWTTGQRFTIAHDPGGAAKARTYLHVRGGVRLLVSDNPPLGPVATTVASTAEELLSLLAGEDSADINITGDRAPLLTLIGWLERAQRG